MLHVLHTLMYLPQTSSLCIPYSKHETPLSHFYSWKNLNLHTEFLFSCFYLFPGLFTVGMHARFVFDVFLFTIGRVSCLTSIDHPGIAPLGGEGDRHMISMETMSTPSHVNPTSPIALHAIGNQVLKLFILSVS